MDVVDYKTRERTFYVSMIRVVRKHPVFLVPLLPVVAVAASLNDRSPFPLIVVLFALLS